MGFIRPFLSPWGAEGGGRSKLKFDLMVEISLQNDSRRNDTLERRKFIILSSDIEPLGYGPITVP